MKSSLKRVITALLAAVMLAAIPCVPAFGAQEYYVNDGENTLALGDAYAIGADGSTAKLPERGVYAATASGTQLLGGSEYDDEQPNIPNGIVRVGLAFGSTALDAVHLQIKTGSGFAFGYYDSDRVFQSVGSTAESAVTVIADTNVTVGDSAFGAYHVQLGDTYASFDAAQAAANSCGGYPVYYNGSYRVRIGSYRSADDAPAGQGTVVSGGARSVLVVKAGTEQILFGFDCGSTRSLSLAPQNGSGAAITQVAECKERNGSRSCTYYGDFQFTRLSTQEPQKLTLVNFVGLEPYVKGVTPYEMSSGWPLEALKAQAIAAHSYALYCRDHAAEPASGWLSVDPVRRQGYLTDAVLRSYWGTAYEENYARLSALVDNVLTDVLYYGSAPAGTSYFAISNGMTEASENVWGTALPYLVAVDSSTDLNADNYLYTVQFTAEQMQQALAGLGLLPDPAAPASWFGEAALTPSGYVASLPVCGQSVTGPALRKALGLRSACFTVQYQEGSFLLTTKGYGHGVGLSQWGAKALAEQGQSAEEILAHYFPGTELRR